MITNTLNLVGAMGKGIALEFKGRYPQMFTDYKKRCSNKSLQPGELYLWGDDSVQILNFPTKNQWKDPSRIEYIEAELSYLTANYAGLGSIVSRCPDLGVGVVA